MIRQRVKYSLFIFTLLLFSCSAPQTQNVAEWQSTGIEDDVFKTSYIRYISSAPVKDSFENRKEYARTLLERKVIASLAQENKFDTSTSVKNSITLAKELSAIKYFVRDKVDPAISETTEDEIRAAFKRKNTSVNLQQIYAPTQEIAFNIYRELMNNPSKFEEFAQVSMIEAGELQGSFNMGWVSWNDMDLDPEIAAFNLKENEISKPVQSLQGWHIFKVTEKQETFFADNTTFQNSKEALQAELEKRKFEEESIRYINSVLSETPLELYPSNISSLWDYLEPQLPDTDDQLKQFLNTNPELSDLEFDPDVTVLARLDGEPITADDFLRRLSSIPFWQLKGNMRAAIETIAKDILFSNMAEDAGYNSNQEVIKETEIEETRILYNAITSAVSDTINPKNYEEYWFSKYRENYIRDRILSINLFNFETEEEARLVLSSFREKGNWEDALTENPAFRKNESVSVKYSSEPEHPAFSINYFPESLEEVKLWGPYPIDNQWSFIEILENRTETKSFEEAQPDLISDISANLPSLVHSVLLKKAGFDTSEVTYNDELLNNLLPYYFD